MMKFSAIVLAAGRGVRFGQPKQLLDLAGAPMLTWSIRTFQAMPEIAEIIVVTEPEWIERVAQAAQDCIVVEGGATRQASARAGLRAVSRDSEAVLVHDGARPLLTVADAQRAMECVRTSNASLLGVPVVDTIKMVSATGFTVEQTFDRARLWSAQTPQCATTEEMRAAHEAALRDRFEGTDDAALLERIGVRVHVVQASAENFKVTVPDDLLRANRVLRSRQPACGLLH